MKRRFVESVKIELGAKQRDGAVGHIPTRGRAGSPRLHRERELDDRSLDPTPNPEGLEIC